MDVLKEYTIKLQVFNLKNVDVRRKKNEIDIVTYLCEMRVRLKNSFREGNLFLKKNFKK
jgi:hypothetical protein